MKKKNEKVKGTEQMNELDFFQQMTVGVTGKLLKDFFEEEYVKCDCPTCKKLRELLKKSEPHIKMVEQLISDKRELNEGEEAGK